MTGGRASSQRGWGQGRPARQHNGQPAAGLPQGRGSRGPDVMGSHTRDDAPSDPNFGSPCPSSAWVTPTPPRPPTAHPGRPGPAGSGSSRRCLRPPAPRSPRVTAARVADSFGGSVLTLPEFVPEAPPLASTGLEAMNVHQIRTSGAVGFGVHSPHLSKKTALYGGGTPNRYICPGADGTPGTISGTPPYPGSPGVLKGPEQGRRQEPPRSRICGSAVSPLPGLAPPSVAR
jgi:hypothetical protein